MTSVEEFTHILDIKIIHNSDGDLVKNKDLLKIVKKQLIEYNYTQIITWNDKSTDVTLSWKKKKWAFPYNKFIGGLVLNSPYNTDTIIQEHTNKTIKCILEELRSKHGYWKDFDIMFHISKPLSVVTPLQDQCN